MPIVPPQYIPIGAAKVKQAQALWQELIQNFAGENLVAQITVAKKTRLIQDAVQKVLDYGNAGSLWEAYIEAGRIVITPEMAPFITKERIAEFRNKIIEAVGKL